MRQPRIIPTLPRHHLLYCTVCVRGITNVLAQCRFHRISKMTSSNPSRPSPLFLSDPSLPVVSRSSPTFISLPSLPTTRTLPPYLVFFLFLSSSLFSTNAFPPLPVSSLSLSFSPYPSNSRYPLPPPHPHPHPDDPPRVLSSSCHLLRPCFFHFPPFVPTNYRRAQFRWIKAAYYRHSAVPTRHECGYRLTVMSTDCDTGVGLRRRWLHAKCGQTGTWREKYIDTLCNAHGAKYEDVTSRWISHGSLVNLAVAAKFSAM